MNQQIFIGVLLRQRRQRLEESERDLLHEPKQRRQHLALILVTATMLMMMVGATGIHLTIFAPLLTSLQAIPSL
jgi:hypothetical protein